MLIAKCHFFYLSVLYNWKHLHYEVWVSNVTADDLVLKHQSISIHITDSVPVVLWLFHKNGWFKSEDM